MRGSRGARATSSGSDSSESPLRILTRRVVCPAGVSCGPTRGGALMTRPSSPWPKCARCAVMITLDLVRKHGMFHSSNLMDDVYPYLHPGEPPVVELPVQWVLDDAPYFLMHPRLAPRPMQSPEVIFGVWRDEFRGFYEWGGLFNLACHPQVIGHPSRLLMLRRLIRFVKRHRGVWWATASEVGDHWLRHTGKR